MNRSTYPESPTQIPENLTTLSNAYKLKVSLAIIGIALFFILYFAMVAGLGWLIWYSFVYDPVYLNKITILLKLGAIAGSVMLFIFTLKFIFKLKNHKPENRIKLNMKEHPELLHFIEEICRETGAPKPKSVYVDPDVNAYVAYTNVWQSLLLPTKKDLTIGLGLVGTVNLSEFKAITAHEFGHFAQRSMKVGSYILSANTIIHDMIFTRDKWDQTLANWRASDIRLSFPAWILTPVIWIIRQILNLFYQFLNIMYSSLSREMEFNADKVAVSVCGSEAIVSSLWKLESGFAAWNETLNHAYTAGRQNMFVKNLYTHLQLTLDKKQPLLQKTLEQMPSDSRGGRIYFNSSANSKVSMYASHPPNDLRENSAKTPFIAGKSDERSPWILFGLKDSVQEMATTLIYKKYLQREPQHIVSDEQFQNYVAAESQGGELLASWDNTFETRFLNVPEENDLKQIQPGYFSLAKLQELKKELTLKMQPLRDIDAIALKAQQIGQGTITDKQFQFNGKTYTRKTLQQGFDALMSEREKVIRDQFPTWDSEFCKIHFALALKLGKQEILLQHYLQHKAISHFFGSLMGTRNAILNRLQGLQNRNDIQEFELTDFTNFIDNCLLDLNKQLNEFDQLNFQPLPNIQTVEELKHAIIERGNFVREYGKIFENGGFDRIGQQIESAVAHCQRVDQKSIAAILLLHSDLMTEAALTTE